MQKSLLPALALCLALTSCGKWNLGSSEDELSTDKVMGGCKLDLPISLDNEDLLAGLTLRDVSLDRRVTGLGQHGLVALFFEIHGNGQPQGYLGARLESADGVVDRGFANDYFGILNFSGEKRKSNSSMLYRTELRHNDQVDTKVLVVVKDRAIQGIQMEFPVPEGIRNERFNTDKVCVKSASR